VAGKLDTPLRAQVKTILLHGTNGNLPGAGGICQNLGNSSPQSPDLYLKIPTPCVPLLMTGNTEVPSLSQRYNIAPSQEVAAVRIPAEGQAREFALLRWGLIPSWTKAPSLRDRMINARSGRR